MNSQLTDIIKYNSYTDDSLYERLILSNFSYTDDEDVKHSLLTDAIFKGYIKSVEFILSMIEFPLNKLQDLLSVDILPTDENTKIKMMTFLEKYIKKRELKLDIAIKSYGVTSFYDFLKSNKDNILDWSKKSKYGNYDLNYVNIVDLLNYAVLNGDIQSVEYILNIAKPTKNEIDDVLTDLIPPINTMSLTVKKIMVSFLENYLIESMDVIESNFYGVGDCASFRVGDIVECINDREFKTLLRLANNILNNIQNHELTKILNIELDKRDKALNNVALLIVDILPDNKVSTVILTDVIYKKYKQKRSTFKKQYNNNEYKLNEHELETNRPLLKYIKHLQNGGISSNRPISMQCISICHWQPMTIKNISTFDNQLLNTTNLFISFSHGYESGLPPIILNENEYVIMSCTPLQPISASPMSYAILLYNTLPSIYNIKYIIDHIYSKNTNICIFTKKVPNIRLSFAFEYGDIKAAPNAVFQYPVKYNTMVPNYEASLQTEGKINLEYEKIVSDKRISLFKSDWSENTKLLDVLQLIRHTHPNGFIYVVSACRSNNI